MANTPQHNKWTSGPTPSRSETRFQGKVALSRWAVWFERTWPRFWAPIGVVAAFLLVTLAGLWTAIPEPAHWVGLGLFGVALLTALIYAFRTQFGSRDEAIRYLEHHSGVEHRPASAYEDSLSGVPADSTTAAIWKAHKERLRERLDRLEVAVPHADMPKRDPMAFRVLGIGIVALMLAFVGDNAYDRLQSAFRFASLSPAAGARLDAWVTPPQYTARPPILLADGRNKPGSSNAASRNGPGNAVGGTPETVQVPDQSRVIVRIGGAEKAKFRLELIDPNNQVVETIEGVKPDGGDGTIIEVRAKLDPRITGARLKTGEQQLAGWAFNVIPDNAPTVEMTKPLEKTRRGAMKLYYKMQDDYGIASAEAVLERMPLDPGDPKTSWARKDILKGPRPPLTRPPKLTLRIPPKRAKKPETWSFHDIGSHPWAGLPVRMTLVARDHAGNVGKSKPKEMTLPERLFFNPFAKAVIEQRRRLVFDPRYRPVVRKALAALTTAPEKFIKDKAVYLGLRSVYHRLGRSRSRTTIAGAIEQLWHVALRIENGGGLSAAEQRLRELQEKLAKALERGASNEEISKLMQQLRQAMNEFLKQLQRQAQQNPQQQQQRNQQNMSQFMRPRDLDRMLKQLEQMAKQGSKQQAQEMLSQLRDLLDRLQSGRMARGQQQQNGRGQQMMKMLNQFGDLIGKQQRLMDDTHGSRRQQGQRQGQQPGQRQGQQGQQGRQGQGQQGQRGNGRDQRGQQQGSGRGQQSPNALGQRQGQLEQRLGRLRRGLQQFGMQSPSQLEGAQRSMESAERALRNGDLGEATREQSRALEQLRQGAQSMAEQMMRQMPSRFGRAQDTPLDPLGRPQRTEGPDLGTSVKLPDEIDAQAAREILNELRRRLGERFRPELELQYLERLLRRF
ncbi:MAG: TIGR02302 family protein [Hyphomicrobiaceae bacterium]